MSEGFDLRTPADAGRYGRGAIAFHWATAALVVVVGCIGLFFDSYPKSQFLGWLTVHALLGLTIFGLTVARLVWRRRNAPPVFPPEMGRVWRASALGTHRLLYLLLLVTPVLGVAGFIAHGRSLTFGSLHLGFPYPPTRSVFHPVEKVHQWLAYSIFALAGGHTFAALWHQFVLKDGVLRRIWPARAAPSAGE